MSEKSILDQIISNHKAEEVANLDAVDIIANLFSNLNERERDVLSRRYGLHGEGRETLENIGKLHKLTRERIRQIENTSINKLQNLENLDNYLTNLKSVISQLIEEHGGLIERSYLLDNLVNFSTKNIKDNKEAHKSHLDFLTSKLLENDFEYVQESKNFANFYKLKHQELEHLEELADELKEKIKELKKIFKTEEIIGMAKELNSYNKYKEKLNTLNNIDISSVLKNDFYDENFELINENKAIYSVLQAAKDLEQNKFGDWGIRHWRQVNPKTINDKIYLILRKHGKPTHFVEIANKINEIGFDKKKANSATVHNELILDDKYVLVGRGLYSLKEWGYKNGTVSDVIEDILKNSPTSLTKEQILEKVLEQRIVKKATIILSLMDKNRFERVESGKYKIKSI